MDTTTQADAITLPSSRTRKPLGVRVTPDQHRILTEAARREHRSVSSFVLQAALHAANGTPPKPKRTQVEILAMIRSAQREIADANPTGRSLLNELMEERRAEAANE